MLLSSLPARSVAIVPEDPPLTLSIAPTAALYWPDQGVVIVIKQKIHRALARIPSVELNNGATTVMLTDRMGKTFTAIGPQNMPRVSGPNICPAQIGSFADVLPGDAWESNLQLLDYFPALPVGEYTLAIRYQYGATPEQSVTSNAVRFSVIDAWL